MVFDKKNIVIIGLCVSIGLNIILSLFLLGDKLLLKSAPTPQPTVSRQEEKKPEPTSVQESKIESEVKIEKEYEFLIPEARKNDPSNDGWMMRKWNGVYSNPERELFDRNSDSENIWPANRNKFLTREQCPSVNSSELPNSYAIFENEELTLRLPFNEKWGGDLFKLNPYTLSPYTFGDYKYFVNFGTLNFGGEGYDGIGCNWWQPSILKILQREELGAYISKRQQEAFDFKLVELSSFNNPDQKLSVLQYIQGGFGTYDVITFSTDKYVYKFGDLWASYDFYSLDMLQDIVSTIELK